MSSRSWGFKSPSGQEYINPSSAQDLCASPMKEKRLSRFSTSDFFVKYTFAISWHINRNQKIFGTWRAKRAPSSAEKSRASPITRSNASVTPCVLIRNRSRLSYLFIVSERMRYESLRTDKRKTARPFFNSRLPIRFRAVVVRGFPKTSVFGKFLWFTMRCLKLSHYNIGT